jgi:predicted lactoylglutathione lyase
MVSLVVDSNAKVDEIHQKALALGAKNEGAPGPRGTGGFYAGYFRDLDGHKINCYCWQVG